MADESLAEENKLRQAAKRGLALSAIFAILLMLAWPSTTHGVETGVTGLLLTSETAGTIVVSWDLPNQTPTDYRVNWAKSTEDFPSFRGNVGNAYPKTNKETIPNLEEGVAYKVRVRARYRGDQLTDGQTRWSTPWSSTALITVASNTLATGIPTISGTATVGETLTAETAGISDHRRTGQRVLQLPVGAQRRHCGHRHKRSDRQYVHAC